MKYALIIDNIVVQVQPYEQKGFIEVKDNVVCGMFFENNSFIVKDLKTDEEIAKEELQAKINKAQYLLDSTQFKFGEDYDLKYTTGWEELKIKRQEAREFIRANQ